MKKNEAKLSSLTLLVRRKLNKMTTIRDTKFKYLDVPQFEIFQQSDRHQSGKQKLKEGKKTGESCRTKSENSVADHSDLSKVDKTNKKHTNLLIAS